MSAGSVVADPATLASLTGGPLTDAPTVVVTAVGQAEGSRAAAAALA